eukprot:3351792-Rhodomonas_salina.1
MLSAQTGLPHKRDSPFLVELGEVCWSTEAASAARLASCPHPRSALLHVMWHEAFPALLVGKHPQGPVMGVQDQPVRIQQSGLKGYANRGHRHVGVAGMERCSIVSRGERFSSHALQKVVPYKFVCRKHLRKSTIQCINIFHKQLPEVAYNPVVWATIKQQCNGPRTMFQGPTQLRSDRTPEASLQMWKKWAKEVAADKYACNHMRYTVTKQEILHECNLVVERALELNIGTHNQVWDASLMEGIFWFKETSLPHWLKRAKRNAEALQQAATEESQTLKASGNLKTQAVTVTGSATETETHSETQLAVEDRQKEVAQADAKAAAAIAQA